MIIGMLIATGIFRAPQANAVADYMQRGSQFQPCAHSWRGESLLDVAGPMRKRFHVDLGPGCISVERQIAWLAVNWPKLYPECRAKFDAGDLTAFQRCWGDGARH